MVSTVRSRYVVAGGVRTHYSESGGNGPVVVGLHGGGAGSSGLAGMGALMSRLSPDIRFIAIDSVGGFGETDVNADGSLGVLSRARHVADVVDALCLDRFVLLGNSQGAWSAAHYAIGYPERIAGLVMIASATIASALKISVPRTPSMKALLEAEGTREGMKSLMEAIVYDKSKVTDDMIDTRFAAATRPGAADSFKAATKGNNRLKSDPVFQGLFYFEEQLRGLTEVVPTEILWGRNDEFSPPELGVQIGEKLPKAKFTWIEEAGHQVQNDQPELCGELVERFVRRVNASE